MFFVTEDKKRNYTYPDDMDVYKKISDYLAEQNDVSSLKKQIEDFGSKKDE